MKGRRVYLSGAIEHASDGGRGWREEIGRFLAEEERRNFRRWKRQAPERFREVVRKIIAWDLEHIQAQSDYVLAFWDDSAARGGGTAAEITLAYRLGKPVYVVLGMPLESASGWVLAAASEVFEDFDQLRRFLLKQHGDRKP